MHNFNLAAVPHGGDKLFSSASLLVKEETEAKREKIKSKKKTFQKNGKFIITK